MNATGLRALCRTATSAFNKRFAMNMSTTVTESMNGIPVEVRHTFYYWLRSVCAIDIGGIGRWICVSLKT